MNGQNDRFTLKVARNKHKKSQLNYSPQKYLGYMDGKTILYIFKSAQFLANPKFVTSFFEKKMFSKLTKR